MLAVDFKLKMLIIMG